MRHKKHHKTLRYKKTNNHKDTASQAEKQPIIFKRNL